MQQSIDYARQSAQEFSAIQRLNQGLLRLHLNLGRELIKAPSVMRRQITLEASKAESVIASAAYPVFRLPKTTVRYRSGHAQHDYSGADVEQRLLPRLYWIAHARRRDLARFDGSRDRASMMFQSCFLAVETKERISAKSIAPCKDRKPPEIFCRSFIMRPSRSA